MAEYFFFKKQVIFLKHIIKINWITIGLEINRPVYSECAVL